MNNSPVVEHIQLSNKPIKYNLHFHNNHQMIFVISGRILIEFNQSRVYEAGPDSLVFISNLEEHSTKILEEPYERYNLMLVPSGLDRVIKDSLLLSVFRNRPATFCNVFDVSSISKKVNDIFSSLYSEAANNNIDDFSVAMMGCLLYELIVNVYRNNQADFPSFSKDIPPQIYKIRKYIDNNFSQPISLNELAKDNYISTSYMSHCFKRLTGYSPMQYMQLNRLSYSRSMLSNVDLTVSEIAYRSGFSDVNNFIRAFKSYYGTTPGQVRKHGRKGV